MDKFIKQIHDVFADLEGKMVTSRHPPEKIDRVLNLIIVDLFNTYYDNYVKTQKIGDYLLQFYRVKNITLTDGVGDLPTDYGHHRQMYLADGITPVTVIPDKFWASRVNSKLSPPSATEPIACIEAFEDDAPAKKIKVSPPVTGVKMLYFKYPTAAKYAYVVQGNRYVYNDADSVDVEFPIGLFPDIINRLLEAFGIVLREGQLIQIAQVLKAREQLK